ncbi:MAG: hypothetical protein ACR2P1_12495 [Pseudomonadales bacterium]
MITIPIFVEELEGVDRCCEPVSLGVPFPKGVVQKKSDMALYDEQGASIPVQARVAATWPDGSVRWSLLDFQVSQHGGSSNRLELRTGDVPSVECESIIVQETADQFRIDTGGAVFIVSKQDFRPFCSVLVDGKEQLLDGKSEIVLVDVDGRASYPVVNDVCIQVGDNGLTCKLAANGKFLSSDGSELALFAANLIFYAGRSFVKIDFTLHNPRAAAHPRGLWDLADMGSLFFNELSSRFAVNEGALYWKQDAASPWLQEVSGRLSIYQDSSGGENWRGNNHKNGNGDIPNSFRGYRCENGAGEILEGERISPFVFAENAGRGVTIHNKQFWQNFPKAIENSAGWLSLNLFPNNFADMFELQGGERKTHTIFIDFGGNKESLNWAQSPLVPRLALEWYERCAVFPYLSDSRTDELDELIRAGVEGKSSFIDKREVVDEYGWRHFGDLYADHEALGYEGDQPLVSHYNNQYDPIYGFARQFVISGNYRWFELMDDLARHVTDIDIYHTQEDRVEYNGGLFWHTNHYLDASTCTHRTFTRDHPAVTSDGPSGGGPGSEHCYTAGLLYHYYLTGSEASKEAVLTLFQWISNQQQGPKTVLGKLNLLRKVGLPRVTKLLRSEKVYQYRYPLTRGTGNYLSTLLDVYELSGDTDRVHDAGIVIQQTVHPNDNFEYRALHNVEIAWSYTVFLQSVGKYLDVKEKLGQKDAAFRYAKNSLLSYANWMLEHEYPYLDKPEILDYANQTWVAQEMRKANIFCLAYKYSGATNGAYLEKAHFFFNYIKQNLRGDEQAKFTRILAVLMQNHGLHAYPFDKEDFERYESKYEVKYGDAPTYTVSTLLLGFFTEVADAVRNFSLTSEIDWLRSRID